MAFEFKSKAFSNELPPNDPNQGNKIKLKNKTFSFFLFRLIAYLSEKLTMLWVIDVDHGPHHHQNLEPDGGVGLV